MSYNWGQLLDLAETVYDKKTSLGEPDACYRTVINRSYFAAHMMSVQYIRQNHPSYQGELIQSAEDHGKVIMIMSILTDKVECPIISDKLSKLLGYRIKADYREHVDRLKDAAESSLDWAKTVKDLINNLAPN